MVPVLVQRAGCGGESVPANRDVSTALAALETIGEVRV